MEGSQGRRNRNLGVKVKYWPFGNAACLLPFPMTYSATFLIHASTASPALPTLPHQESNKKLPCRLFFGPMWWRQFINWHCPFPYDSGFYQVYKNISTWVSGLCVIFQTCRTITSCFDYPHRLDHKMLLLKTLNAGVMEHAEVELLWS